MGGRRRKHHIEIRVLGGGIAVTREGSTVHLGSNQRAVLHALVLGRGEMKISALDEVLPPRPGGRKSDRGAVKNALSQMRNGTKLDLDISERSKEVTLKTEKGRVWIDLWAFFDAVDDVDYKEARALIAAGAEPKPLEEEAAHNSLWQETFDQFAQKRREVLRAIKATTGRNQMMRDTRDYLLKRSLVPGIGREVPIASVRERIEAIGFPWKQMRPEGKLQRSPLPAKLAATLSDSDEQSPAHLLVVGGGGAGKTLAAISTYLLLTDSLTDPETAEDTRLVMFVDGQSDSHGDDPDAPLASNAWFEQRLLDLEADDAGRPILVMSHADSFFSKTEARLDENPQLAHLQRVRRAALLQRDLLRGRA